MGMTDNKVYPTHTCFDDALDFIELLIKANPADKEDFYFNMRIVHAICLMPDGQRYAHAWVEDDKTGTCIFRGIVNSESMYLSAPKVEFYENFKVMEATRYTIKEAIYKNFTTESYGPWEEKYKALVKDK